MSNQLCDLLGIDLPIILGGMMFVGRPPLVAAVSQAGGLGILGAGRMAPRELEAAIGEIRTLAKRPFGVNIPLRGPSAAGLVEVALELGVKVVSTSAGSPALYTPRLSQGGVIVIHVAATVAQARKAQDAGVDIVVAEGCESGGFLGKDRVSTMALLPQVVDALTVPVVAAGGIADGRGVAAAFALGAQGVQLGTRFLAARECSLPAAYKQALLLATDTGTFVALNASGAGRRVMKKDLVEAAGLAVENSSHEHLARLGALDETAGRPGNRGYSAGQGAGLIDEVLTAKDILERIMKQALETADGLRCKLSP